ncbi:DUF2637 domain-containing protein [Streptomyces sp. NPDC127098]|uniref:DUF2637 domain-containing protein n=1 Tax=Streptomyces sp. NPDC127098 TaxID=3347137 RepID=UPI0036607DF7
MTHTAAARVRISGWDRMAILGLGAAGGVLSFDALQQMAAAIHVRDALVWLFPLVIDGFIAYSVRALVVLRDAHFAARLYVWALFSAATATSIWANGLHAVRLNQQNPGGDGLRLGDITVGVLSTIAPLALAGAVHLYILIARRSGTPRTEASAATRTEGGPDGSRVDQSSVVRPTTGTADLLDVPTTPEGPIASTTTPFPREDGGAPPDRDETGPGTETAPDEALLVAQSAVQEAGRVSRRLVRSALQAHQIKISNERLGIVLQTLRNEASITKSQSRS